MSKGREMECLGDTVPPAYTTPRQLVPNKRGVLDTAVGALRRRTCGEKRPKFLAQGRGKHAGTAGRSTRELIDINPR